MPNEFKSRRGTEECLRHLRLGEKDFFGQLLVALVACFCGSVLEILQQIRRFLCGSDPITRPFLIRRWRRRHKAIQSLMDQEGVEALLVYGTRRYSSDVYWLTDWPCSREAYVLFESGKEPVVVLMQLYNHFPMARVMSIVKDVRWGGANTSEQRGGLDTGTRVGIEEDRPGGRDPVSSITTSCAKNIPAPALADLSGKVRTMRTVRSPDEIERIRFASKLTDQSIQALAGRIKEKACARTRFRRSSRRSI